MGVWGTVPKREPAVRSRRTAAPEPGSEGKRKLAQMPESGSSVREVEQGTALAQTARQRAPIRELHLSASLMCADPLRIGEEIRQLEDAGIDGLHIDIMDGHFVPNLALSLDLATKVRRVTHLPIDVHLMVDDPEYYVNRLIGGHPHAIAFHLQPHVQAERLKATLLGHGVKTGLAITSITEVDGIAAVAPDYVLCMSVPPGFAGQSFDEDAYPLVEAIHGRCPELPIWVDGAINEHRAQRLWLCGATGFVLGTAGLFRADRSYAESTATFAREVE
ncbi:MAG: ribulose-phosphate 3-epimerase [Bacilli bacterium]